MTSRPIPLLLVALLLLSSLAPLASAGEVWTKETGSAITAVATDEYGDRIFVGTADGYIYIYDSSGSLLGSRYEGGEILDLATTADGSRLSCTSLQSNHIREALYSVSSAGSFQTIIAMGYPIASPSGTRIDNAGNSVIYVRGSTELYSDDGKKLLARSNSIGDLAGDGSWVVTASASDLNLYAVLSPLPDNWGVSRNNRAALTVTGSPDGTLTNYPVEITVIRGSGTSTDNTLYAPDCQSNFGDIRFTAADGVTELPYYLKSVSGSNATFWVGVPSIPQSPGTATIYAYWQVFIGTSSATTTSNHTSINALYDDFEDGTINTALWTTYTEANGAVTEANGYLRLYSSGTSPSTARITSTKTFSGQQYYIAANASIHDISGNDRIRFPLLTSGGELSVVDPSLHLYWGEHLYALKPTTATPQALEMWWNPATSARIKYGSDWDETRAHATLPVATSLPIRFETGSATNDFPAGEIRIYEITVLPYTPNPPTPAGWSAVETVVTPLDTKTLDGTIIDIDAPETGDWVAVSTTTKTCIIEITDSGFGAVYSADRTGTPYAVAIANNGANTIEGRGILADIFRFDGVQTGTYTAGGPVRTVAVAQKNGLYAAAGSDDGKYYIFSKDESSSWYLLHASDSEDPVTAIAMSWRGEIAVIGRADGSVVLYTTTDAPPPDSQMTVYAIKDGQPYIGKPVSVSTADVSDPDKWTPLYNSLHTDSDGKIVISTHTGHYYQININNGEKIVVIQASSATPIHSVVFRSPLIYEKYNYDVQYNASSQAIEMAYTDNEGPATVSWSIVRTDIYSEVYSHTISGATTATATYPISEPGISYKVNVKVQRSSGGNIQNMWFITPQNASPLALPFWDENIQNAVFIVFLMILGGVFYYSTGAKGALIVALVAALFRYFSWITVPWFWVIAAVVFAFLANIAEGA